MLKQQKIFFDFLRFCIGSAKEIPGSLKEVDWKELYAIAKKQALLGVLFYGIQRLPKQLAPEQKLLMQWMVMAEQIRKQNIRLFLDSVKVCKNFENKGFANCILKGQGNALLYPDPYMRTPGDIDIYLAGGRKRVGQSATFSVMARRKYPKVMRSTSCQDPAPVQFRSDIYPE